MTDLISRIITLKEDMIMKSVPSEVQQETIETLLSYYEQHRSKTGSFKHLVDKVEYAERMKERLDFAHGKTLDYLRKKGY